MSALEDLRVVAVSRLMLDNFDHIKAYWISLGVGTAQTALAYGADDLDGTVRRERIHHDAGAGRPKYWASASCNRSSSKRAVGRSSAIRSIGRCEGKRVVSGSVVGESSFSPGVHAGIAE